MRRVAIELLAERFSSCGSESVARQRAAKVPVGARECVGNAPTLVQCDAVDPAIRDEWSFDVRMVSAGRDDARQRNVTAQRFEQVGFSRAAVAAIVAGIDADCAARAVGSNETDERIDQPATDRRRRA